MSRIVNRTANYRLRTLPPAAILIVAPLLVGPHSAEAGTLTLTPAGIADGFGLTTFATVDAGNANTFNVGPLGVAIAAGGNVIVNNYPLNVRYSFSDIDGQTPASALNTVSNSGSSNSAFASAGGQAYGAVNGRFAQFNSDGTVNHILTGVTPSPYLGMAGNPVTGTILASSSIGIIEIDPSANGGAGSFRLVAAAGDGDGLSVSPDGQTVYSEQGAINGYNIASGQRVYTSGFLFNSPDGTGVISSSNNLNGDIIVNNNNGEVDLLNPANNTSVAIATGGTRGDYVSPDVTNGTLFMDFSDVVDRLSCGNDCSIGSPVSNTPEPSSFALLAFTLLSAAALCLRRRKLPLKP